MAGAGEARCGTSGGALVSRRVSPETSNADNPARIAGLPRELAAALAVAAGFALFLVWDQSHWWRVKEDYAFGYIVPLFVAYVVQDRWAALRAAATFAPATRPPAGVDASLTCLAAGMLVAGLGMFALGALNRAGSGSSQPASLALAIGFAATLLALAFLGTPRARGAAIPVARGLGAIGRAVAEDPRRRVAALLVFPALVWVISAPLVSAVENSLSTFLLGKVTAIVFLVFDVLGLPLERSGNILILPKGEVGVAEACSGIRSLTGSIFAGAFLAAVFLRGLWKKLALLLCATALAFATNILRSLTLTGWAYVHGAEAIEGAVHDVTGYAVLGVTTLGLLALLPVFNFELEPWLRKRFPPPPAPG